MNQPARLLPSLQAWRGWRIVRWVALALMVIAAIGGVVYVIVVYGYPTPWTGFSGRTLWEWLSLLGVPVMLALATAGFGLIQERNRQKSEQVERDLTAERSRDSALEVYLNEMGQLMLEHELGKTIENDDDIFRVRAVARVKTLTILRVLGDDIDRRSTVGQFLSEAGLMKGTAGLYLSGIDLSKIRIYSMAANGARLNAANLQEANLSYADMEQADLRGYLQRVHLDSANLTGADLSYADLQEGFLEDTNLQDANLDGADLQGTYMVGANLQGVDLGSAEFDERTTLPDGSKWTHDMDLSRFIDPQHPQFWRSDNKFSPAYRGKKEDAS